MIFGIGLPRSAGQTLQYALSILGFNTVHSPGSNWEAVDKPGIDGAVEVFAPPQWLVDNYPGCKLIFNVREMDSWLASCMKVWNKSQRLNWNHPIWKYPMSQFEQYRIAYYTEASYYQCEKVDLIANPSWDDLCRILDVPVPEVPFPNIDRHGRINASENRQTNVLPNQFPSPFSW